MATQGEGFQTPTGAAASEPTQPECVEMLGTCDGRRAAVRVFAVENSQEAADLVAGAIADVAAWYSAEITEDTRIRWRGYCFETVLESFQSGFCELYPSEGVARYDLRPPTFRIALRRPDDYRRLVDRLEVACCIAYLCCCDVVRLRYRYDTVAHTRLYSRTPQFYDGFTTEVCCLARDLYSRSPLAPGMSLTDPSVHTIADVLHLSTIFACRSDLSEFVDVARSGIPLCDIRCEVETKKKLLPVSADEGRAAIAVEWYRRTTVANGGQSPKRTGNLVASKERARSSLCFSDDV